MRARLLSAISLGTIISIVLLASPATGDEPPGKSKSGNAFPDLVAGLKATPGCLGADSARTASGKQVIFAWFKDKKAVLRWYHSDMHQQVMKQFFPTREYSKPLKDVPDDSGPIMAIASITFADKSQLKETKLPIKQISIELYQPISGGISLGGRFAPDGLKVPNMRDYTPKKEK